MVNFLLDKRGNFSVFRVSLAVLVIGILVVLLAFVAVFFEQESLRSPLEVNVPSNAEEWVVESSGTSERRTFYRIADGDAEQIANFYNDQLLNFPPNRPDDNGQQEECQRTPPAGNFPDFDRGESNVSFFWRCFFGRSAGGSEQYTIVSIYPGFVNEEFPELSSDGYIVIEYEQNWQP